MKKEIYKQIEEFIDQKEQNLEEIIKIFFDIKYLRFKNNEKIFSFQEILATVMYEISSYYNILCKEFPECDEKENYKQMMKMLIKQSKAIGDGYAWLFYRENIEAIREHLNHENNGLFPTRNGGIGEIEFIKNNKVLDGCFVIYHSITNILRNGDFSLITAEGKLAGIGEIKTKHVENQLVIDMYITTSMLPCNNEVETIEIDDERIWEKLRKQLKQHENIFKASDIELNIETDLTYICNLIKESADKMKPVVSDDHSMLVFVANKENVQSQKILDNIIDLMPLILNDKFMSNKIIQSELRVDERLWELPLICWELPEDVLINILLRKWLVFTWFNEDYLLNELIKRGYRIQRGKKHISVEKILYDKQVGINDITMYIKMATTGFVDVESVIDTIEKSIKSSVEIYKK